MAGLITGVLAAAATTPALAMCAVCNASVRLDAALAICFSERLEAELKRLESGGLGFVIVDLSDCPSAADRGTLPIGGVSATAALEPLDTSFVLDGAALRCLGEIIAAGAEPLDPSRRFDLAQLCP